jgi:hypothetical protein
MSTRRTSGRLAPLALALAASLLSAGCADYLNHRDTVTLAAGDAVQRNIAIQTVHHALPCEPQYPCPSVAYRTEILADGTKILHVVQRYKNPPQKSSSSVVNVNVNPGP